jgi:hypothetical protein
MLCRRQLKVITMSSDSGNFGSYDSTVLKQPLEELLGISRGLLADHKLSDDEIHFLREWLDSHYSLSSSFPGNVIHQRVKSVLEDGVITEEERSHLVETLKLLMENRLEDLAEQVDLTELWFDEVGIINFDKTRFCLTGNFVYGPAEVCKTAIEERGGIVTVTVKPDSEFLVVGGLGVDEWRSGGLGAEIETAVKLRAAGKPLKIIPEDALATHLKRPWEYLGSE